MNAKSLRQRLMLSSTVLAGALGSYARQVYASCVNVGGSNFECSGTNLSTRTISAANATVTTLSGFSVTTGFGNGVTITGDGALSYDDELNSSINAASTGLYMRSTAVPASSVTIDANGDIRGNSFGVTARNLGGGALNVTLDGDVTGTTSRGIFATNAGTDFNLTIGANGSVTGATYGIFARNYGSGATSIAVNGDVTATGASGIGLFARDAAAGTAMTVTTGAGTAVTGRYGMFLRSDGSGALTVTVGGDVTGNSDDGIYARHAAGHAINIAVGAAGRVISHGSAADDFAIETQDGATDLTVAGTLAGGSGGAVRFDPGLTLNDRLELQPGASITGAVLAGPGTDSLVLGGSGSATFDVSAVGASQQYQGFETFLKEDSSHWTLTGANAVIGAFAVNGGQLSVDGSMSSTAFTVNGGTLGGSGTIGALTVLSGGTFAPGNSIGTQTINGNLTLNSGAVFAVEVSPSQSDKAIVNGAVDVTGATLSVIAAAGSYAPCTCYLVIENDGTDAVTGSFATVTSNLAFLDPIVDYAAGTGNDVQIRLIRNDVDFCAVASTSNQCGVGTALNAFPSSDPLLLAVIGQTAAGSRQAFDALSGEMHAAVGGTLVNDSRYVHELVLGRLLQASYTNRSGRIDLLGANGPQLAAADGSFDHGDYGDHGDAAVRAPPRDDRSRDRGLTAWMQSYSAWGKVDGSANAAPIDRSLGGIVAGADAPLFGDWRLGVAAGYSQADIRVDDRYSQSDVESLQLSVYAGGPAGPFALRAGGSWARSSVAATRYVVFPGFSEREDANYDIDTWQTFGELAYPTGLGQIALEPFLGLAYVESRAAPFTERGRSAALRSAGSRSQAAHSTVGLRAATSLHAFDAAFTPHAALAWQHAFEETPSASFAFASTGSSFSVTGAPIADNSLLLVAGFEFALGPGTLLGVSYTGQFSADSADNILNGHFTWRF